MAGYQAADASGRFRAQPRLGPREEASPPAGERGVFGDAFDFDELDADPSERKPGSALAQRLWAAETKVRQWKWLSVGLLFLLAMFLQSIALYFATRRYVQWISHLEDQQADPKELELTMRLLQPRDTFALQALGIKEASSLPLDLAMLAMPLLWLLTVVAARNLRLWTRTLLAASVLAIFTGVLASLTMLPRPMGWEACEANLREDVLSHYRGADGLIPDIGKALGLMCWIWLQDVLLGMRVQGQLVCAGSSMSGCSWFTALFALALYDLSRMWSRKLKPHFRDISHLACGGVLTAFVLLDAGVAIAHQQQYTAAVAMGLVMALLVYQSPALAVCTDQLLIWNTPALHELTKGGEATPLRETTDFGFFTREDPSRDFGDVVVPPCCIPFCLFHGRYFLYAKPAAEYEQELVANLQAQAELEKLQKEQEQSTLRLLDLEGQLEALHTRNARRAEEEPKEFERHLQDRLQQQRVLFEEQLARVQVQIDEAEKEKLRIEADAQANDRKKELLHAVKAKSHLFVQGVQTLPQDAWAKIYARFEVPLPKVTPSQDSPKADVQAPKGDFRALPMEAWQKLHQRFASPKAATCVVAAEPLAAVPVGEVIGLAQAVSPGPGLVVKSYGILGLSSKKQKADPPDEDTVLVDPAGLPFIRGDKGPCDAKGAAEANYRWLEIDKAESFPEEVKQAITEECQAKYYAYADGKKKCIHVVGPDLRTSDGRDYSLNEAVKKLALAYANVFAEFVTIGKQQGLQRMRLLPISGGIFSGDFKEQLPEMTARAVQFAYDGLSQEQQSYIAKSSIEMCIFMESEFPIFAAAFGQPPAMEEAENEPEPPVGQSIEAVKPPSKMSRLPCHLRPSATPYISRRRK